MLAVSIPNGMEFYGFQFLFRPHYKPFQFPTGWNSTLRWLWDIAAAFVSIPNGMEFYDEFRFDDENISVVSIPNGMEFYQ